MNRKLMMAVLGCAAAFACAAVGRESRQAPIKLLDRDGARATRYRAPLDPVPDRGGNGCEVDRVVGSERFTRLVATAETRSTSSFLATLGAGPKTCTFTDGLHPSPAAFQGTVNVEQSPGGSGD